MTYDFFADENDIIEVLDYIFTETDLELYQLASDPGESLKSFRETAEVRKNYKFWPSDNKQATFHLWSPRFRGELIIRKIDLKPRYCKGHTFRYATEGWGLIQLYFGVPNRSKIPHSHIGHQSEKRALLWESISPDLGPVKRWDWKEVESTARKLKYQIHTRMSIGKINSMGILRSANQYINHK